MLSGERELDALIERTAAIEREVRERRHRYVWRYPGGVAVRVCDGRVVVPGRAAERVVYQWKAVTCPKCLATRVRRARATIGDGT